MATSPTYLPTYSLAISGTPNRDDFMIAQKAGSNGDTCLINIGTFMNTFVQSYIDDTDTRMDGIDTRIDGVDESISAIQTAMGGVKMKAVIRTISLPAGGGGTSQTTIDFSAELPSNAQLVGVDVTFGDFHMPYARDGSTLTWVSKLWERAIRVDNRSGVWTDYQMYATLFYTEVTSS